MQPYKGSFTAAVEVVEGRLLVASFLQHVAANRRVVNPLEVGRAPPQQLAQEGGAGGPVERRGPRRED